MDLALNYNSALQAFDLAIDGTDLAAEDTLASATLVSLLCDRLAETYEVNPGENRRGWWADAYAENNHKTGSRLWLLERQKQLQSTVIRCQQYCEEALQWFIDDGLAKAIVVTVFVPRSGWLAAIIKFQINGQERSYRFEFDQDRQLWRLAGEALNAH
jgi:phage gp46-like protein